MEELLQEIEKYSDRYDFSFQFWGAGHNSVYISKDHIDLIDRGGYETIQDVLKFALEYVYRINRVPMANRIFQSQYLKRLPNV